MQQVSSARQTRPRSMVGLYAIALAAILIWALFPVAAIALSSAIAEMAGCTLNEAGAHPCIVLGHDIGGWLVTLFTLGWLGIVTLPTGAIALALWCVMAVGHAAVWLWQRRKGSPS